MGRERKVKAQRRRERIAQLQRPQSTEPGDLSVGYWAVAYLDILGYKSALLEMSAKPPLPPHGSAEEAKLKEAVGRTVKIRRDIVGLVDTFMRSAMSPSGPLPDGIPPGWAETALAWRHFHVGSARFSDSFFFYASLAPSAAHPLPMRAVYTILLASSAAMLFQMARGSADYRETLPIRGALDINVGMECADRAREGSNEKPPMQFYSAAMATAYQMETTQADWPRILVSDDFRSMVRSHAAAEGDDPQTQMTRRLGNRCGDFLFQDTDGLWAVDYLGAGLRAFNSSAGLRPFVLDTHAFARAALAACVSNGNAKVAKKYERLEQYIASRLPLWA